MWKTRQFIGYAALRIVICLTQALPLWLCDEIARALGFFFDSVLRMRRRLIDGNLEAAFPELSPAERRVIARGMWRHLFQFAVEVVHTSRRIHLNSWQQFVELPLESESTVAEVLLNDRPLVMVTAHFANFELATYLLCLFGHRIYSVARPLDNPYLDGFVNNFRGGTGQTILSKQDDYDRIRDILAAGGKVSFVADQYAGTKGCWVKFFGREASAHKAIALFALDNDAPIVVGGCRRVGKIMKFRMTLQGMLDPRTLPDEQRTVRYIVEWYNRQFENMIRAQPDQYWWLHNRWKDNREKHRALRKQRSAA